MTERELEAIRHDIDAAHGRVSGAADADMAEVRQKAAEIAYETRDIVRADQSVFNWRAQVGAHPWLAFGSAVLAGYLLGSLQGSRSAGRTEGGKGYFYEAGHMPGRQAQRAATQMQHRQYQARHPTGRVTTHELHRVKDEFGLVRDAAFAASTQAARNVLNDIRQGGTNPGDRPAQPEAHMAGISAPALAEEPSASANDPLDHFEKKGSFATGLAEKDKVEGTNVREGSFATGLAEPDASSVEQPDPDTMDVIESRDVQGTFATGMAEKDVVEGSNVREGSYGPPDKNRQDM